MGQAAVLWPFLLSMHHIVLLLCLDQAVAGSVHGGNEIDRLALLSFKAGITGDPFGALNSWNESIHFCQWTGVTCGRRHRRVTVLVLDHLKLSGSISPCIGNISFLRELRLRNNSFSHNIPPELGHLHRLRSMSLLNNSLSGQIPMNISACSNLVILEFGGNRLIGNIPAELGYLSKLEQLRIYKNNFVGGVPSNFGNLSSLTMLSAAYNSISGNIPNALGQLTKLEALILGANRLVGTIHPSIFNLSAIRAFDISMNQIQGSLPSNLGITFPDLEYLGVGGNFLSGSIPLSLSNASKLYYIRLPFNNFTGTLPPLERLRDLVALSVSQNHLGTGKAGDLSFLYSLTNTSNLNVLDLGYNNFGGVLPQSISNLSTNLGALYVQGNKITGDIPPGIRSLVNLEIISLSSNQITGNIHYFGKFQNLKKLSLARNEFYGDIPSSFGNLTLLLYLNLTQNNLHGGIPESLTKCKMLMELYLENNNLSGTIPKGAISLPSLLYLYLSYNNLTGSLLEEVGNLEELYVSNNQLSGEIPITLGSCVNLRLLYMGSNKFWGTLPSTLTNLRGIEEMDFSSNNFSGKIPDYFEDFPFLHKLNLSFNDFEGEVLEGGIFKNTTAISLKGNDKLCGGISELQLPSCSSKGSRKKRFTPTLMIIIFSSLGLLGLILVLRFLYCCWFRKAMKVPSFQFLGNPFLKLSYQSLLKATDGFSQANLLGVGSSGSVYKGVLDGSAKVVAVKVLNLQVHGASKSFIAECKALKSIKHRNLVKVLTACSSIDYRGNDFKALIYEFMVNGSIEKWLHPDENQGEVYEGPRNLNFLHRLNIAIDVACALEYLHHHCPEPIVHCDVKPSNILLDAEMIGHVGDFGLARFLPKEHWQSSSTGIRGSVGYVAPEYGMGNEVSTSGDVYSYGILLLEMFTGKRPTDDLFTDSLSLHSFVKTTVPEHVVRISDPTLFQPSENGEASSSINNNGPNQKIKECLISMLKIGVACSEELVRDRPAMNTVVNQLHAIKNTLLRNG